MTTVQIAFAVSMHTNMASDYTDKLTASTRLGADIEAGEQNIKLYYKSTAKVNNGESLLVLERKKSRATKTQASINDKTI